MGMGLVSMAGNGTRDKVQKKWRERTVVLAGKKGRDEGYGRRHGWCMGKRKIRGTW